MEAAIGLTFVWLGCVLSLSFLEAPLKFRAPGITRQLGLGIGRLVFRALHLAEFAFAFMIVMFLVADSGAESIPWVYYLLVALLGFQGMMFYMHMDKRAVRIVAGETLPPDRTHLVYIGLEVVKVAALLLLGTMLLGEATG